MSSSLNEWMNLEFGFNFWDSSLAILGSEQSWTKLKNCPGLQSKRVLAKLDKTSFWNWKDKGSVKNEKSRDPKKETQRSQRHHHSLHAVDVQQWTYIVNQNVKWNTFYHLSLLQRFWSSSYCLCRYLVLRYSDSTT